MKPQFMSLCLLILRLLVLPEMVAALAPARSADINILLITLDTTRADHLGCYGFAGAETPNLDGLASAGVRFANCYTPVPLTLPAHASLLTGKYPLAHGVRNNASYILSKQEITLAEYLQPRGFATFAVVASYVLLAKFGLGQGFDVYDDSLDVHTLSNNFTSEIRAAEVYEKFSLWFNKFHKQKFFAWIHFYDPHHPYAPPPPYDRKFSGDPYSGEIAYMDSQIGRIIVDLKAKNLWEKTIILVAGDHGEDLGEHKEYGHGIFCYEQSLRVPLIVCASPLFLKKQTIEERVNLVDVLPTVLDLCAIPKGPEIQGRTLLDLLQGEKNIAQRDFYFESLYGQDEMGWAPLTGLISGNLKYISLPKAELYDLSSDQREAENLYLKKNILARQLDKKLRTLMLGLASNTSASRRELSAADKKHLASLGYISSFGKAAKAIDPKRGNQIKDHIRQVIKLVEEERLDEAEGLLKKVMAANPDIRTPLFYDQFEEIYKKKKDLKKLLAMEQEAVRQFPGNSTLKMNLAYNLFNSKDMNGAEKWCQEIIKNDPSYTQAHILLGNIRSTQGRLTESIAFYEKALTLEPQNFALKKRYATILLKKGDRAKALAVLDQLAGDERLSAVPANLDMLEEIAAKYLEIDEAERAIALLRCVLRLKTNDAKTWNDLGSVYFKKHDMAQARECYEKGLAADPGFALSYSNLGALALTSFVQNKDRAELGKALACFDQAIARDSTLALAYNGRAAAYRFGGRQAEALQDWKKALELNPGLSDAYFNIGITYLESGEKAQALKYFQLCREKNFAKLSLSDQKRLQRLIAEAEGR